MKLWLAVLWIAGVFAVPTVRADDVPDPSGARIVTNPDWIKRPRPEDIFGAWPIAGLGMQGRAVITCRVNIQGLAEDCRVISEVPPGKGFGGAALVLAPQFLFHPKTIDGRPVPSEVTIPINFSGPPPPPRTGDLTIANTLIDRPLWAQAPLFEDVAAAYPKSAGGRMGYVVFRCGVGKDGSLRDCNLINEDLKHAGFEKAGRNLLHFFRLDLARYDIERPSQLRTDVAIRLVDPTSREFTERVIGQPMWLTGIDPKTARLFPDPAAKAGLRTGRGIAACMVAANGALTACSPGPADPPGLGFSELAVRVAEVMRMNRWSGAGSPIDGARITLPVRFNLEGGFSDSAKPKGETSAGSAGSAKKSD